ncbi:PilZ domain-containing protein [Paenibacillus flagellatus]|uniref:PilZ domain-containing protein n=1 Tax=Paenibacillus flagellatus TaxID=2211139 RepID=UPI001305483A|nr:PilZ domain-containing protein [Paenibacillus flagellatus]
MEEGRVVSGSKCRLILVGETKDGQPFCYEDRFTVHKLDAERIVAGLAYHTIHPLEKLHHLGFIELSFLERGMLYYGFADMLSMEMTKQHCLLTLAAPETVRMTQQRKSVRVQLASRIPITCRIVGVRGEMSPQSVVFYGQMIELSAGGVSFVTSTRLFEPLLLELTFVLPSSPEKHHLVCEIVRVTAFGSDSYRVAAEFRDCPPETIEPIDRFCRANQQGQEREPSAGRAGEGDDRDDDVAGWTDAYEGKPASPKSADASDIQGARSLSALGYDVNLARPNAEEDDE